MKVLMFGWEFPPNISGGLGTACYGIVKGLAACNDVNVTFVVPKAYGNEQLADHFELISANRINVGSQYFSEWEPTGVNFLEVTSKLVPYHTPESFAERYQSSGELQKEDFLEDQKINFSVGYFHKDHPQASTNQNTTLLSIT